MNTLPNFDGMDTSELYAFAHAYRGNSHHRAAKLVGSVPGRVAVMHNAVHYCRNLITARACRERGEIPEALRYETICEDIYAQLPEAARW